MNIPAELKYTKDHEWVKIDGDIATVGITDFAQSELGDIVYVEVDTLDESLDKDAVFGTVEAVKTVSDLFLPLSGEVIEFNEGLEDTPEDVNTDTWYIAMSNHQAWADIFILLAAGHKKIPLLKFFMKKELQWIPIIYLVHKTIDMPFLNRHSRAQIQANPELKKIDFENAKIAAKRFSRNPSTAFSFAEGTRFTLQKHSAQESPYSDLLKPKVGALAIALSGMPQVNTLVDFTVVYATEKRSTWDFLCGNLSRAKVAAKTYALPENLKNRSFEEEDDYRRDFQTFVDTIWLEKEQTIKDLKL